MSSRFEFRVLDRVLLLMTGLGCDHRWSLFDGFINAFVAFLKSSLSGSEIKTMKQGRAILGLSYSGV